MDHFKIVLRPFKGLCKGVFSSILRGLWGHFKDFLIGHLKGFKGLARVFERTFLRGV